jgi:hypothetical protein
MPLCPGSLSQCSTDVTGSILTTCRDTTIYIMVVTGDSAPGESAFIVR